MSMGTCVISALWNADRRKLRLDLKVQTAHCGGKKESSGSLKNFTV